jgi:hypothetical protein
MHVMSGDPRESLGIRLACSVIGRRLLRQLPHLSVEACTDDAFTRSLQSRPFQLGVHAWPSGETDIKYELKSNELVAVRLFVARRSVAFATAFAAFNNATLLDDAQPRVLGNVSISPDDAAEISQVGEQGERLPPSARVTINGMERRSRDGDKKSTCSSFFRVGTSMACTHVGQILFFFRGFMHGQRENLVFADVRPCSMSKVTGGLIFERSARVGTFTCLEPSDIGKMIAIADHPIRSEWQSGLSC